MLSNGELKEFLDEKADKYNHLDFIESDPISIPHRFSKKEDIEISGFLTATIAWGRRAMILKNADRMMDYLDNSPYEFIIHHTDNDLKKIDRVIHRTFHSADLIYFIKSLNRIYNNLGGLEKIFEKYQTTDSLQPAIHKLKELFLELPHETRTEKHISDPFRGSAAKRINMFLRWMVRNDNAGVDFGIWNNISPSILSCPLDVHSGRVARYLGILERKLNDQKAVAELDSRLRAMNAEDPVKYDFALFGLGISENTLFLTGHPANM